MAMIGVRVVAGAINGSELRVVFSDSVFLTQSITAPYCVSKSTPSKQSTVSFRTTTNECVLTKSPMVIEILTRPMTSSGLPFAPTVSSVVLSFLNDCWKVKCRE